MLQSHTAAGWCMQPFASKKEVRHRSQENSGVHADVIHIFVDSSAQGAV